jgi:hypothetical protein
MLAMVACSPHSDNRLAQVFTPEMLGAEVPYFEAKIGPAMRVEKGFIPHDAFAEDPDKVSNLTTRTYKLGSCYVKTVAEGTKIRALGLAKISSQCTFDLNPFTPGVGFPSLSSMTFAQFDRAAGDAIFTADCLEGCGNCCRSYVYDVWNTPHVYNFIQVAAMGDIDGGGEGMLNAEDDWRKQIVSASGEQYLVAGTFNTDCKFDKQAHNDFAHVRIEAIWIADSDVGLRSGSCL